MQNERQGASTFQKVRTKKPSVQKKQKEPNPSKTTARKKGGRRFSPKHKISVRCLVSKQNTYRGSSKKETPPQTTTTYLSKDTSDVQQKPTNFYRREPARAKSNLRKDPLGQHAGKGGDVFLQKQNPRVSPSPTLPNKPPGGIYQKGGETFFLRPLAHPTTRHLEGCTKHSTSKDAHNKAPRRMHTSKHSEVCTRVKHLEGCTKYSTSKDAHNKVPRRMQTSKHLEGCIQKVTSKDARRKASRRMHTERKPEGCAIRSPGKGNHENNIHVEKRREGHIRTKKKKRLQ